MSRRRRSAALVAIAALSLAACVDNDAKRSDVVDAMTDAGLEQDQAECVGARFDETFGDQQDLYNDIGAANDPEDYPEEAREDINAILEQCVAGDASGGDTDEDTTTDETTDDTSADG